MKRHQEGKGVLGHINIKRREGIDMPLNKDFDDEVKAQAQRDPDFRVGLLYEAIEVLLDGDLEKGKALLRHYINATIGFKTLAIDMKQDPKNLMRMLSTKGNPKASNLLSMIAHLKRYEGVTYPLVQNNKLPA